MILRIDTGSNEKIDISFLEGKDVLLQESIEAKHRQSEKLLPFIDELLSKSNKSIDDVEKIMVNDEGEGFSSLRIGVITANALAYALGIEVTNFNNKNIKSDLFTMVEPKYSQEPNIG